MRERTDGSPRAHQEPAYAFLDRAAGARWERVRAELDGWFARLPAAARADLRNRFAQAAELDHAGAFWELWVHEAHRRRGFEVTVNIGGEAGERRQDFVLARGRERCWLEATVVGGDSPLSFTERRLDEQLRDIVATVRAPRFSLALEVVRYGACSPGRRHVVPPLERWLGALDPRELRAPAVKRLAFDDFVVDVEAIALPAAEARPCGCAQLVSRGAGAARAAVNDVRPLRRKIKKKAARYGDLDRPYLLAVLALGDRVCERDVEHALLGAAPRDHAVWHGPGGPCNTRLSGVLVGRALRSADPVAAAAATPALWRNPWASRPLGLALPWRDAGDVPVAA
ncbi:MAG TPA: hypothetical protein VN635_10450 [Conexibacter sp.]|nr:hypothetical protein [Conexibacter sp.]